MFQFPGFALKTLCIQVISTWLCSLLITEAINNKHSSGLPHSEIRGSKPILGSPRLIAEYHVLHRLLLPRHPPNALLALDLIQKKADLAVLRTHHRLREVMRLILVKACTLVFPSNTNAAKAEVLDIGSYPVQDMNLVSVLDLDCVLYCELEAQEQSPWGNSSYKTRVSYVTVPIRRPVVTTHLP